MDPDYNPDGVPEASLVHGMDGIVLECMTLYGLTDLEAAFMALQMNIEGFTAAMVDSWQEQGQPETVTLHSAAIGGFIETIKWVREKAEALLITNKFNET